MIFIRADANSKIGSGHVMRCLSIAKAFAQRSEDVVFITADHKSDELITRQGFTTICLDTEWTNMVEELPLLKKLIQQQQPSLLLVDSYYVTQSYFDELAKYIHVAYIDDMNLHHWNADYLINYNIFSSIFDYSSYDKSQTLLLGLQYAPLRDEFKNLPRFRIREKVKDMLVSAGGADPECITEQIMAGVCKKYPMIMFHFIVGALNPRMQKILQLSPPNAVLHINEQNMSKLMQECDLAISAAGTTLYELCATGIPTITYTIADN